MPKITDSRVIHILDNPYFDHHAVMHLARLRLHLPGQEPLRLFLPGPPCADCDAMKEAGQPGSGTEFLDMHHEMIRVFRFLLQKADLCLKADWQGGKWQLPIDLGRNGYSPLLWDLDEFWNLPHEIVGMLNVTDPDYLRKVFEGVKQRTSGDCANLNAATDDLGLFIERGVDRQAHPGQPVDGSGFHNTMHEYLASREGKAAYGAEMNKLRDSMYNDYFWSLHVWIDGQYGRLLEHCGKPFDTTPLDPAKLDDAMEHGMMSMTP